MSPPDKPAEFDLVFLTRLRKRDERAFSELVVRYETQVYRLVWRMLGNAAESEDMTQEVFVQVFKSLDSFRGDSKLSTWIYRIATNVSLDHLRKRQTLREEISYESDTESHPDRPALKDTLAATTYYSNPERRLYGKEVGERIKEALKTLSEKERLVFELRHYQGLRLKMIGEIMGSTEETAKNYLFRATQKLRAFLTNV